MDFLKAEIERKKRQMEEKGVMAGPNKKYFKRGDLAEKQREEYIAKHAPNIEELKKTKKANPESRQKIEEKKTEDELAAIPNLPKAELVRRLRERGHPILLFGETLTRACERLKQIEMDAPDATGSQASGLTNDFKEARETVDQEYMKQMLDSQGNNAGLICTNHFLDANFCEPHYTYQELSEIAHELTTEEEEHSNKIVREFILVLMKKWGQELNDRNKHERNTTEGKMEAARYVQTRAYLKPIIRMIRKHTVSDDIRDSLVKMVKYALQRDYITSNECYLEMAIGNAPWPIGVTNAGIHARPARENISSKYVAHVLNDETQRKFIQGLKRLLTKAQQYYPTDPSRCVDYVKNDIKNITNLIDQGDDTNEIRNDDKQS